MKDEGKYVPIKKRTPEDIYLEFVNDFITVENMAQWYGVTETWLLKKLNTGKYLNYKN